MKKFLFRLEPCLQVRRHREECEEIRLGELIGEQLKRSAEKETILSALQRTQREMSGKTRITSAELNLYRRYMASLERKRSDLDDELIRLAARIDIQRSVLLKARQRRKVVDRLKERRRQRYEREADRKLQAEMEELHLLRLGRE